MIPTPLTRWIGISSMLLAAAVADAQDFRVETDVFVEKQKEPVAEFLTIFYGNTIYDYLISEPQEVTVFDMSRGRFVLLDPKRSVKTEITTTEIELFGQQLRERAMPRDAAFFHPQLTYTHDEQTGWHRWESEKLTYRAKGITPKFPEAAQRYRVFADWYAQLSAMRPGNLPPYGRLELNKVLAEKKLVPEEIERTVTLATVFPARKLEARTHHLFHWILSEQDQRRIRKTGDQMASFQPVTPEVYFQSEPLLGKK